MSVKDLTNSKQKAEDCFQLKSDFLPLTVIKLTSTDLAALAAQLSDTIEKAPKYFVNAPVIIDINDIYKSDGSKNLPAICKLLRDKKIIPVGVRGLPATEEQFARDNGLALFQNPKSIIEQIKPVAPTPAPKPAPESAKTKIITQPIRAGSTVYAKESDLVIMAAVNSGAECIADGNIHIYGPLRGRASAGARGDTTARIFCTALEAELVSIAGHYLVKDSIPPRKADGSIVQIYLKDKQLIIEGI